jgi:colanic acid/amylovoran biosynthesis glycosyltransferase
VRIAYLMSRFPKITETFVLYEMLAVEAQGHTVDVYPLLRARQPIAHPEAAALVHRARFAPFLSASILRAHAHFLCRRPRAYFGVLLEVLRGTWGSANFFVGALGIFPKVVRFAFDMERHGVAHVHAHFANHPALAALVVHRLTGIPFSFTAHGSDLLVERRMLDRKVAAAAFVVAISAFNRELVIGTCGETCRRKVRIIHCGVDPAVFAPRRVPERRGPFTIVCVASFEPHKGHRILLDACRRLRDDGVEFACHLVGDGPLRGRIESQIHMLGLGGHVVVHGARTRAEVADLLATADVAALASLPTPEGRSEGIPVVLMEAMASGVPVVATRVSGIPELVDDGRTGLLAPPGDAAALAECLGRIRDDVALGRRLAQAGREKVQAEFDLRANAARLAQLFAQAHADV